MPSAPIISQASGKEGPTKILRQLDAQQKGNAPRHVHAPGKIHIQPHGVQSRAQQNQPAGQRLPLQQRLCEGGQTIGDHQLFKIAPQQQRKAGNKALGLEGPAGKKRAAQFAPGGNGALG